MDARSSLTRPERARLPDVDEADVARLARLADRLLLGTAVVPAGTTPRRRRAGRGLEFFELRPYGVGDSPREIDWRASARTRAPVVRTYRDEAFATAWLCLDCSGSMHPYGAAKWTRAVQVVAALAYLSLHAGNRVGLLAFADDATVVAPPTRGRSAYAHLVRRLAELPGCREGGASRLDRCARLVSPNAAVTVVSDFLAPDHLRYGLAALLHRSADVAAVQLLAPAEMMPPAIGRAVLRDSETGERRVVDVTPAVSARASASLIDLCGRLAAYCRTRGVPLTRSDTDATWRDVVLAHLRAIQAFHG